MQNTIIVLGAIVGMLLGGWFATLLFYVSGDVGVGVTMLSGAIPGTIVGGWLGLKLVSRVA